ncbi:hypothetical protein BDQ12DRAFT_722174 [Crucibulum laeve]|uniref:Uncharacterized protein n=1 Tax=Crucibulum laeve TaxID=68775 RepID=A0A5C3M3H4_9AGAR|nr:hypothetical protein BDQ12DRAFT_722174 [Crucibulum laeve]
MADNQDENLDAECAWNEFITSTDLCRFGSASFRAHLNETTLNNFNNKLNSIMSSCASFLGGDADENSQNLASSELPKRINALKEEMESQRHAVEIISRRIVEKITDAADVHENLESDLTSAITKIPPSQDRARLASNDLLAATIEASLIKLSLILARARRALYQYSSTRASEETVSTALSIAHMRLKTEEEQMKKEERTLDKQLQEYEQLVMLVDDGGYKQVIEDWTRVKRETEECKRDLRRLGWTGD